MPAPPPSSSLLPTPPPANRRRGRAPALRCLRWRPPPGPWRSTSRSWSSTHPQTSNSKVSRLGRARAGNGAGGRAAARPGRAALPSPTPAPSVGTAAPLRPSARASPAAAARLLGPRRGGDGASRAPRRAQPSAAAILRPAGAPRGRRGSPPAPCSLVCWPARRPCPGAAAACSGPRGRRPGPGASGLGAAGSAGPAVAAGRRGPRGEARRAGWGGHGPRPESPLSGTGLRRAGRPGRGWLGLTPSVGRAPSARQRAVRQLGEWKVVGWW